MREVLGAPDILAVQEAENLGVLEDLAARILADDPSLVYTAYLLEGNDIGGIDIGFLVRDTVDVDSVDPVRADDTFVFNGTTFILNDRPPLLLQGSTSARGAVPAHRDRRPPALALAVSRAVGRPAHPREAAQQALRLSQFMQSLQTADPAVRLVALGDFNAFEFTDGYVDVMGQVTGNLDPAGALVPGDRRSEPRPDQSDAQDAARERYSFVFDGIGAVARPRPHLQRARRRSCAAPSTRAATPTRRSRSTATPRLSLRSSDHDGPVLFIMSDDDADGLPDDQDVCLGTAIPEAGADEGLGVNPTHWALATRRSTPCRRRGRPGPELHHRRHRGLLVRADHREPRPRPGHQQLAAAARRSRTGSRACRRIADYFFFFLHRGPPLRLDHRGGAVAGDQLRMTTIGSGSAAAAGFMIIANRPSGSTSKLLPAREAMYDPAAAAVSKEATGALTMSRPPAVSTPAAFIRDALRAPRGRTASARRGSTLDGTPPSRETRVLAPGPG